METTIVGDQRIGVMPRSPDGPWVPAAGWEGARTATYVYNHDTAALELVGYGGVECTERAIALCRERNSAA